MKVAELISLLEQYDEDAEVRLMMQPSYPFEYSIRGVVSRDEFADNDEDAPETYEGDETESNTVYITEGSQLGYGARAAFDCC